MGKEVIERSFLILGGTGNVGKYVVSALAEGIKVPAKVFVGTRHPLSFPSKLINLPELVIEPVHCDLNCTKSVATTVTSAAASSVFLCLPQSLAPKDMECVSNAVVDAAKKSGATRLVRIASLGIDGSAGQGQGALGDAHVACEAPRGEYFSKN